MVIKDANIYMDMQPLEASFPLESNPSSKDAIWTILRDKANLSNSIFFNYDI